MEDTRDDLTKENGGGDVISGETTNSPEERKAHRTTSKKLMHLTVEEAEDRRLKNNENERIRTHAQVDALYRLAKVLPPGMMAKKKWSKQFILSSAIGYIRYLGRLVADEGFWHRNDGLGRSGGWEDGSHDFLQKLQMIKSQMGKEWDITRHSQDSMASGFSSDSNNNINSDANDVIRIESSQKQQQQQQQKHHHQQQQQQQQQQQLLQQSSHPNPDYTAQTSLSNVNDEHDATNRFSFSLHENNRYVIPNSNFSHGENVCNVGMNYDLNQSIPQEVPFLSKENDIENYNKNSEQFISSTNYNGQRISPPSCIGTNTPLTIDTDNRQDVPQFHHHLQQKQSFQTPYDNQQLYQTQRQHPLQQQSHEQQLQHQLHQHHHQQQHPHQKHLYPQLNQRHTHDKPKPQSSCLFSNGVFPISNGQSFPTKDLLDNSNSAASQGDTPNRHFLGGGLKAASVDNDSDGGQRSSIKVRKGETSNCLEDSGYISSPNLDQWNSYNRYQPSAIASTPNSHFLDNSRGTPDHHHHLHPSSHQCAFTPADTDTHTLSNIPNTGNTNTDFYHDDLYPRSKSVQNSFDSRSITTTRKRKYTTHKFSDASQFPVISLNSFFETNSPSNQNNNFNNDRRNPIENNNDNNDHLTNHNFLVPKHSSTPIISNKSSSTVHKNPLVIAEQLPALNTPSKTIEGHDETRPLINLKSPNKKSDEEIDELFSLMQGSTNKDIATDSSINANNTTTTTTTTTPTNTTILPFS